ncbi:MAG: helix-turn-helix transcriptional regulator [Oscillospiraceae bacterium]|nr:helix-turn-helix transcriptional regulator [Oscillospiraceae bacterium]
MGFGEKLRAARESKGLTQQQIADQMGIDKSTYCGYETGKRQPDLTKLKQLSQILGISGDALLETGFAQKEAPAGSGERSVSDDEIKFALFGGSGDITDAMYEEVRRFAAFVKLREAEKKKE